MAIEQINTGNRIYPLDIYRRINNLKKFYEKLREPYKTGIINLITPDKLNDYRIKKIYGEFMEHLNDVVYELRKQADNNLGNLVDITA